MKMEEDVGGSSSGHNKSSNKKVEISRAERSVWLMKCPPLVSRSRKKSHDPSSIYVLSSPSCQGRSLTRPSPLRRPFFPSGKVAVEGKVEHKFRYEAPDNNIEEYRRLCRERTDMSMIRNRQVQQFLKEILNELCAYNKRGANQGTYELKPAYKKTVEDSAADQIR